MTLGDAERLLNFERRVYSCIQEMETAMAMLDTLIEKVTRIEDRSDAIIALVHGLAAEIRRIGVDQVALDDLAKRLDAQAGEIDAAVVENTPEVTPPA